MCLSPVHRLPRCVCVLRRSVTLVISQDREGMSQPVRRPAGRKPAARARQPVAEEKRPSRRRAALIWASVVLVVLGLAIGLGYYFIYVVPFQYTIIKVNDVEIKIDYFVRRLSGGTAEDIFAMIEAITNEELIRQGAPRYGINVTDNEVMDELRNAARGENVSISEPEFQSWYRAQLNESGLSDAEFKELTRTYIMVALLQEYLAARTPSVAEQVHLHYILLDSYDGAVDAAARLDEGADFAELAAQISIDEESGQLGGDMGWWPLDALGLTYETYYLTPPKTLFNLDIGEASSPIMMEQDGEIFAIFMLSERAVAREIDEDKLEVVKSRQIEKWLTAETVGQDVTLHGRNNGFDSETHAWIQWQLARRRQ